MFTTLREREYSSYELNYLILCGKDSTIDELSDKFGRSKNNLKVQLKKMQIKTKDAKFLWTEEENIFLQNNHHKYTLKQLTKKDELKGRTQIAIKQQLNKLNLKPKPSRIPFSIEEEKFLLHNAHLYTIEELSMRIPTHKIDTIRLKCKSMNLITKK